MFALRSINRFSKSLLAFPRYPFVRDVGDVSHLKKFKAGAHKNIENEISSYYGETTSILITQPLETLLSCLSACELRSIMYWAKDNNVTIESLEIYTDASYDSRNYTKNTEGSDITQKVESNKTKETQAEGNKTNETKGEGNKTKETQVGGNKTNETQTEKYRNKKNVYEEVNIDISIKTSEKDKNKVLEILKKGQETCPVHNVLAQAGVKINSKFNIL
jgi:uncharacterized OsmC-like protein